MKYHSISFGTRMAISRKGLLLKLLGLLSLFLIFVIGGSFIGEEQIEANMSQKNLGPSIRHLFGTDWLGRDMFFRTLSGLHLSFRVGLFSAAISTLIALILSLLSSYNKYFDAMVTILIDLLLSIPHLVTLILIAFVLGGGVKGVVVGIALTHWPSLTRVLRAELMQMKTAEYVQISKKLGKSRIWMVRNHFLPQILPQLLVGFILLFPHAILHESAITFLGFGLSPEQPAIGIILAESMKYLTAGMWWLVLFPGLSLILMVAMFEAMGNNFRKMFNPQ
ncbi:ABC transporter permease [Ureibacillus sp. FSL K6-8385]|uniref:ABC transporter permease n=1 Tax=Ureibacillus terrenus TaxID=118246 RepID=A0A540UWY0_9BACL|nr:ABC transporter permease [Ureibacillus terrenus]MED3661761.1 ABC transporter permease [Ureibacillus terrenus]MED3763457.1 ABC transporter permease [Ureibacillus terrenus]TQE88996.1 ABC transporter permease [Ureibacillus terrenus]